MIGSGGWHNPTLTMLACSGLSPWLEGRPEPRVEIVVDPAVVDRPVVDLVRSQIARTGLPQSTVELPGQGDPASIATLAARWADGPVIVGIGGGAVLDQVKLAAMTQADPATLDRLRSTQRCGLVVLPPHATRRVPVVAVPTTLGTGAEVSAAACVRHGAGKRLVMSAPMRPDVAVLDPVATATLPVEIAAEGVLEVLARILGLYVGDHDDSPTQDALAEALAVRAVELGGRLAATRWTDEPCPPEVLRDIATVSGLSHSGWLVTDRFPYGYRGWYLANELSTVLGLRKMTAMAAVLPALWRTVLDGDERLGSARRLRRAWDRVRAVVPVAADPADGLVELMDAWGIARRVPADDTQLAEATARVVRAWGAGLPMIGGLSRAEVSGLLERCVQRTSDRLAAVG